MIKEAPGIERGLYKTLGEVKCEELAKKARSLWTLLDFSQNKKSAQVRGVVIEGIVKDFIREFLPVQFGLESGLIFESAHNTISPQVDAIIYSGVTLLDYSDAAVAEKEQVRAIFEIKSLIDQPSTIGGKSGSRRNLGSGLALQFDRINNFLPAKAISILFAFELHSSSTDDEVITRLNQIYNRFTAVIRREPIIEGSQ